MHILSLLTLLFYYSLCLTTNYYQECLPGTENIDIISVSECRKYDTYEGFCCYLQYENKKNSYNVYIPNFNDYNYNYNYKTKENKTFKNRRKLVAPLKLCYGLSKDGYEKINDVIEELIKETGVEKLSINCRQNILKISLLNFIFLLLNLVIM